MSYNQGDRHPNRHNQNPTPGQQWQTFLAQLKKDKNPLYELLKDSELQEDRAGLKLYFCTEEAKNAAKKNLPKIQAKLPSHWQQKRLNFVVGQLPPEPQPVPKRVAHSPATTRGTMQQKLKSPLQALNQTLFFGEHSQPALKAAADADNTCASLYQQLTKKTKLIADDVLIVKFNWRVRVGGMRGFRDLLLPVFHPVYGVSYIPSSSLKGAVRAWARKHQPAEVNRLLGTLDDGMGCVQILDAFPTKPCLSVDMANPQWSWTNNQVKYQPVPHALLSMEEPELVIGLVRTSRGEAEDVQKVKGWLEQALGAGIGSRVSAGYGRTSLQAGLRYSSSHEFGLWTQGMYGAFPPSKDNGWQGTAEFRSSAIRGMLRYWFRAIALGLYDTNTCKQLETQLFGTLSVEGSIRISVESEAKMSDRAYVYKGKILLEAKQQSHLTLVEKVLHLSSHLGGVGRGARRPLHWNSGRMRGCHWQLVDVRLPSNQQAWQEFLEQVRNCFLAVQLSNGAVGSGNPGNPGNRNQDVLNRHARIYLVLCPRMKHPKDVSNWAQEGNKSPVTGNALDLLYSSTNFKGVNRQEPGKPGNPNVGGDLGTPSFVVIKSNFPNSGEPYQTVTIFGAQQSDRADFEQALPVGAIQVWPIPQAPTQ